MKIVWSAPAVTDLDAIHNYIARDSETYADAIILEIFEAAHRLERFPESGRIVPELNDSTTRGDHRRKLPGDVRHCGRCRAHPRRPARCEAVSSVQMKQYYNFACPRQPRAGNRAVRVTAR